MKEYKWFSADIHPEVGKPLACITTRVDGSIKYTNFGDDSTGPYWYNPNKEVPDWCKPYHTGYFDNEGQSISFSYWMYWKDFWELLENFPKVEESK